jgi:hypothetical protein
MGRSNRSHTTRLTPAQRARLEHLRSFCRDWTFRHGDDQTMWHDELRALEQLAAGASAPTEAVEEGTDGNQAEE